MTTPERIRRRQRIESTLVAILCGLLVIVWLVNREDEAEDDRDLQAAIAQTTDVADRNADVVDCLTVWVEALTDALADRDVVNKTARSAERETWATIHRWLRTQAPGSDRTTMLRAIDRFEEVLRRLEQTELVNPYPAIKSCLDDAGATKAFYRLTSAAARRSVVCAGLPVTIRGTGGGDLIRGTEGPDVIRGFGGGDLIFAGDGNDIVCGGRGGDTINGGQGFDRIRGQRGSDLCIQSEAERSC